MTAWQFRNLTFDVVRARIEIAGNEVKVTQQYDRVYPAGPRMYTKLQGEALLAAWRDLAHRMPSIWACEEAISPAPAVNRVVSQK